MEFHEKLQFLRKQKNLTQEDLAGILHVSRTAVSKWESGRGYPNIDSLKAIARFYGVTVDDLLSGEELLTLAQDDHREKQTHLLDLIFGCLDLCAVLLLILPFFANRANGTMTEVSLCALSEIAPWLKAAYFAVTVGIIATGILIFALQNNRHTFWINSKYKLSLLLNGTGVLLFTVSLQPYAAVFLLIFAVVKLILLIKSK